MDEDCLSRICSSSLTPASPKEVMQYSSDDFKKLQSHCYSCGSETGAFKKYKATRKSGAPEMRFRCGKCRRFTGNIYVKLRDDTYMLSRLGD
ncbi:unnamed protein product [Anisakis simplex]|uniref:Zf-trcl domain-containing protein n=1 Tax=Anisakis simplex TaxID=6269 RepID=A0A0M3KH85_ANISI|nr:unnamed protein product [Anisakis simplex]